jgi:hypothetical protein
VTIPIKMEDAADEQRDRSTNMTTSSESDKAKGYVHLYLGFFK